MNLALEPLEVIHHYRKHKLRNRERSTNFTHSGSIILIAAVGAAGVAVVDPFWNGAITVSGKGGVGVVDMIGLFWAVSVISPSSILKRVESSRMDALINGDSNFEIFCRFLDGRDEPSFSSDLRIRCIHDP